MDSFFFIQCGKIALEICPAAVADRQVEAAGLVLPLLLGYELASVCLQCCLIPLIILYRCLTEFNQLNDVNQISKFVLSLPKTDRLEITIYKLGHHAKEI